MPCAASTTSSSCSRAMAPARSRHQPSAREPITLAPSTIKVTWPGAGGPAAPPAPAGVIAVECSPPGHPAPGRPAANRRKVGLMVETMLSDKITRMRQRRTSPLILELDLTEGIAEEPPADPLSAVLSMRRTRLADVLDGLRRARADDRVKALVVKVGGRRIGIARVQELRAAITEFRACGKAAVAW